MRIRLLALVVLLSALSVCGCGAVAKHQVPVAIATTTTTPTAAPAQDSAANKIVYLEVSGAGTKSTQTFNAVGDWNLLWSYDCTQTPAGTGNFIVNVMTSTGQLDFHFQPVNQMGAKGSDTEYYHRSASAYLTINSQCSWTVKAEG